MLCREISFFYVTIVSQKVKDYLEMSKVAIVDIDVCKKERMDLKAATSRPTYKRDQLLVCFYFSIPLSLRLCLPFVIF